MRGDLRSLARIRSLDQSEGNVGLHVVLFLTTDLALLPFFQRGTCALLFQNSWRPEEEVGKA